MISDQFIQSVHKADYTKMLKIISEQFIQSVHEVDSCLKINGHIERLRVIPEQFI